MCLPKRGSKVFRCFAPEILLILQGISFVVYPKGQNGDGTLQLRVGNPGLALDIQHMEPVILSRINAHFGYRAISRIKLIQAPLPPRIKKPSYKPRDLTLAEKKSLDQQLENVEDSKLKNALEKLGKSVTGRN